MISTHIHTLFTKYNINSVDLLSHAQQISSIKDHEENYVHSIHDNHDYQYYNCEKMQIILL